MNTFMIVITSASVGALISASITFLGQYFERKGKREELLLSKAIELAIFRSEFVKEIAFKTGNPAIFHDAVINAANYYKDFNSILKSGAVQKETKERDNKD